ncbi:hypothetical protein TcG_06226 [Trypanosoma cruzi]|nr:hypothetical protein TcG_06226 [Trypanosoma cruzi]
MRHTRKHFKKRGRDDFPMVDMEREVRDVASSNDVRTLVQLVPEEIEFLLMRLPPVTKVEDLDTLSERLSGLGGEEELGFSPLFCPLLIDAACQRGIFPLALSAGGDRYIFAPKLHYHRCLTQLEPPVEGFPMANDEKEGKFQVGLLQVSKKYLCGRNEMSRARSFDVFINRKEDIAPALSLIVSQHGENWMCRALRACFVHMFLNQERYRTKIVVVTVRRHCYGVDSREEAKTADERVRDFAEGDHVEEGDLVAAEIGFIAGDIYTSATGAYSLSGSGTLQLAVTGEAMRSVGCKVWDLGMAMAYKSQVLGCVTFPREKWLRLVREHVADTSLAEKIEGCLREKFSEGVAVRTLFSLADK